MRAKVKRLFARYDAPTGKEDNAIDFLPELAELSAAEAAGEHANLALDRPN